MSEPTKFCKDCKHYKFLPRRTHCVLFYDVVLNDAEHQCWINVSKITGNRFPVLCEEERQPGPNNCGPLAVDWEPK